MQRQCDLCGKEDNERLMKQISFGRKTEWWCWECYKNSQREANASDRFRQKKLNKIKQSKKRNR